MTIITVDARECGAGKTHGVNGTISKIRTNIALGNKVLVCVPSIHLSYEYQKAFPSSMVIVSDIDNDTVQNRLANAIMDQVEVIIITHQAFMMSDIPKVFRKKYALIIDETFDPWRIVEIKRKSTDEIFDWKKYTKKIDIDTKNTYAQIKFIDLLTNSITAKSSEFQELSSINWHTFVSNNDLDVSNEENITLNEEFAKKLRIVFIQELCPTLLVDWASIHIAGAWFDFTFMSWWMKRNGLKYAITDKAKPHSQKIVIHVPNFDKIRVANEEIKNPTFTWTRYKQENMSWLIDQYHQYVNNEIGKQDILRLKNNYTKDKDDVFVNSHKVNHNAAGLNSFSSIKNVSLESVMNPNKEFGNFLNQVAQDNKQKESLLDESTYVYWAKTGYTHYQVLMRSYLRTNDWVDEDEVNVFLLDERCLLLFIQLFDNCEINEWEPDVPFDGTKETPLTTKEKDRAKYLRKKYPNDARMETRALLKKYTNKKPMTEAERKKKQREQERQQLNQLIQLIK